jgi:hypothetical protein
MRTLLLAVAIVLLTAPSYSQGMLGGRSKQEPPAGEKKTKPDEKGYNSAIGRMPDKKYDPWQSLRGNEPVNSGKKSN